MLEAEFNIRQRIIDPNNPTFSLEAARAIRSLEFPATDQERMRELAAKVRGGELTAKKKRTPAATNT